jgi:hypothetical protein
VLLALHTHDVATRRHRVLREQRGQGLEEALCDEVAVWDEGLELLDKLVMKTGRFGDDALVVLEAYGEPDVTAPVVSLGPFFWEGWGSMIYR